jgi:hypothetical protein
MALLTPGPHPGGTSQPLPEHAHTMTLLWTATCWRILCLLAGPCMMLNCTFIFNASDMKFMKFMKFMERCCATTGLRFSPSKPVEACYDAIAATTVNTQAIGITNLNRDAPLLGIGYDFSTHGIFAQRLHRRLNHELKSRAANALFGTFCTAFTAANSTCSSMCQPTAPQPPRDQASLWPVQCLLCADTACPAGRAPETAVSRPLHMN